MPEPSIVHSCPHCGERSTYRLVPQASPAPGASTPPLEIPSIDLRCLRCDASQTYRLVPEGLKTAS